MTCNKQSGPIIGGVYEDSTLKNPIIIGGVATGLTLIAPDINGGISLDDATASILAKILAPYLPELVGSLFKNCEGNALPPGTQLMSCAEILKEIELAICRGCTDGGGGSGTDVGDRITNFTFDSNSRLLTINVKYADDTTRAWTVTLPASGGGTTVGDVIQNFSFNSATGVLTILVTQADGNSKSWPVDISSLKSSGTGFGDEIVGFQYNNNTGELIISVESSDSKVKDWIVFINPSLERAPRVTPLEVDALPLSIMLNHNQSPDSEGIHLLGTPITWAFVKLMDDDNTYKIPLYYAH